MSGRDSIGSSALQAAPPAIPFRSSNELGSRFFTYSKNTARFQGGYNREALLEVDLDRSYLNSLETSLDSSHKQEVTGTIREEREGVLFLNIEFGSGKVPKYLSAKSIAEMLEMSPRTIYRMHKLKSLPGVRIGRNLRFRFEDVLDFLDSRLEKCEG